MRYFAYKNPNFLGGRPPNPLLQKMKWDQLREFQYYFVFFFERNLLNVFMVPEEEHNAPTPEIVRTLDLGPGTSLIVILNSLRSYCVTNSILTIPELFVPRRNLRFLLACLKYNPRELQWFVLEVLRYSSILVCPWRF